MNNSLVLQNFARLAEIIANVGLGADPIDVTGDAFAEIDSGFVTGGSSKRSVAGKMAHFAGTKFAVDLGRDVDLQNIRKPFGNFANRRAVSAADVYSQSVELIGFRGEKVCARDVFHEGKLASLFAVFVKYRRQIVQQPRAKNRDHARVRIKNRLPRSVGGGLTQRDSRATDLFC